MGHETVRMSGNDRLMQMLMQRLSDYSLEEIRHILSKYQAAEQARILIEAAVHKPQQSD